MLKGGWNRKKIPEEDDDDDNDAEAALYSNQQIHDIVGTQAKPRNKGRTGDNVRRNSADVRQKFFFAIRMTDMSSKILFPIHVFSQVMFFDESL